MEAASSSPSGRLRVGDCVVDMPSREVRASGARRGHRITPKALGVLRMLVEHAGKVVTRDALLAEVWRGTLPTDDVLTQAVTQLRRAFGGRQGDSQYIETIAKAGYRLLAPVEWLPPEPESETGPGGAKPAAVHAKLPEVDPAAPDGLRSVIAPQPPSDAAASEPFPSATARAQRRWRWWMGMLAIAAAVALAAYLFLGSRESVRDVGIEALSRGGVEPAPERPYRLLTSAPGFELWPTLSPDASMVAYAATRPGLRGTAIQIQTTNSSQPLQISNPMTGASDRNPAWSPDGREIAYLRHGPGAACQVLVTAASGGGGERSVAACDGDDSTSFDWAPDGRTLVFGSMRRAQGGNTGLRLLDLASGQWRDLAYPGAGEALDHEPHYSPDGRWIGFIRDPKLGDLWRIPAAGGRPERLTDIGGEFRGWDWLADGKGMVFGLRVDSESRLYRLDLETRRTRDLGLHDAQAPAVAKRAGVMAFVRRRPQFGLFRVNRSEASGPVRRESLFASSGRDTMPSLAPDGRQLAFASDRSGHFQLWWADLQDPRSLHQIEGLRPDTSSMPEWSPDSRRMLMVGRDDRGRSGVFEVVPASGQVAFLPMPGPRFRSLQAMYTPDPDRILITVRDPQDKLCLVLLDRSRSPWKLLGKIEGVSLARVDARNRRVLFTRLSADGLWQADLSLAPDSIRVVDARKPSRWRYQTWAVAEDGSIDYLEQRPDCLSSLSSLGGDAGTPTGRCLNPDHLSATTAFSSSSRLDAVFTAQAVDDGTDIGLMPLQPGPGAAPGSASRDSASD